MQLLPELPFDVPSSELLIGIGARSARTVLILLAAFVATKIVGRAVREFGKRLREAVDEDGDPASGESEKRVATLSRVLRLTINIGIWAVAVIMALREIGYDVGPMIAGAGVAGLAIGFGAQNLVRDVITGLFLLLENQVRVGDVAVINGQGGLVEEVNLRTIVLRDLEGTVHIFSNGAITALSNRTREHSSYVFDIGVAYKEDTDCVSELIARVSSDLEQDPEIGPLMLEPIQVLGVDRFADSAVMLKAKVETKVGEQWKVGREANRRLKRLFDAEGVEMPFPHVSLYTGEGTKAFPVTLDEGSAEAIRTIVREELAQAARNSSAAEDESV